MDDVAIKHNMTGVLLKMTARDGSILTVEQHEDAVLLRVTDRYGAAVMAVGAEEAGRLAYGLPTVLGMLLTP